MGKNGICDDFVTVWIGVPGIGGAVVLDDGDFAPIMGTKGFGQVVASGITAYGKYDYSVTVGEIRFIQLIFKQFGKSSFADIHSQAFGHRISNQGHTAGVCGLFEGSLQIGKTLRIGFALIGRQLIHQAWNL